jgi:hypothetical protein
MKAGGTAEFCVVLNEDAISWNAATPFDVALDWRFRTREAAEGCCETLNRLLGYPRFRVGWGLECSDERQLSAQIT